MSVFLSLKTVVKVGKVFQTLLLATSKTSAVKFP